MEKILIFNGYYIPAKNYGGPLTSIQNVIESCSDMYEFYVVSQNCDFGSEEPFDVQTYVWQKVGKANVMYIEKGYLNYSFKEMLSFLLELKPSLVWYSGVLVPKKKLVGVLASKQLNIPVLFSPRGEVNADHIRIKGYKKKPYLRFLSVLGFYNNCYFHSTCDDETNGINKYFHPKDGRVFCVTNVATTKQNQIENHQKEEGVLKAFFQARIHPIKGIDFVLKCLSNCKSKIIYDIYGPIEDALYWQRCQALIRHLPKNITVNYCGYLEHNDMSTVLQKHDCLLFATSNENFSHTIAESLANARPVIISRCTTPWDDIDRKAGFAISLNEPEEWSKRIDYFATLNNEGFQKWVDGTSLYYDTSPIIQSAVKGHKAMFETIINATNKTNNY